MSSRAPPKRTELVDGSTVAVIGGGPAGAFFAIHLLRQARALSRTLTVTVFERRRSVGLQTGQPVRQGWRGCNYCAGGISPKLLDVLQELHLTLPEEIVQCRIRSISIQGFWKNIELEVPPGREMLSVYRGSRPHRPSAPASPKSFDAFLLDAALTAGAGLISGEVTSVTIGRSGRPTLIYSLGRTEHRFEANFVVFAAGVNESRGGLRERSPMLQSLQSLVPGFQPARLRPALIFELEARPKLPSTLLNTLHFVEYGSPALPLEMCSLVPKRGLITVVLVGPAIDQASGPRHHAEIMRKFLELSHIRKLIGPGVSLSPVCLCRPNMVVGSARYPFGDRVAVVGDLVTSRLYKDGILSACQTARALADTALRLGVDAQSLAEGYEPTLRRFRRGNRLAALVFLVHRLFFSSSVLSRVLYQAAITERKKTPSHRRHLEKLLWRTASGDDDYQAIFLSMIHPATVWSVVTGGALITLRNYLTELVFGLHWEGFGRFTTGVAFERLEDKRREFSRLMADASVSVPGGLEFERMYTIKIAAPRARILEQLGRFGEPDRGYLKPRGIKIRRVAGLPNQPGCVIQYKIGLQRFCFHLALEQLIGGHLAVYRVRDGFAGGGMLLFEIEQTSDEICALSIYVAFNFARGQSWITRPFWWLFRLLFPAFVHDVVWNHSLCELKDVAEASGPEACRG